MSKKWKERLASRFSILKEFLAFLWNNRLWWMIPIFLIFFLLGLLIIFTQSSAVLPFIYTLF